MTNDKPEKIKIKKEKLLQKANPQAKEYLNNRDFTAAIAAWIALNKPKPRPEWTRMPNDIGKGIMKIVDNFALKGRWRSYTYIEDMRSDAFLTVLKYIHNFNIEKSNNAFAYVTQITKFAFQQFTAKENNQANIKNKVISESSIYNFNNINLHDGDENWSDEGNK